MLFCKGYFLKVRIAQNSHANQHKIENLFENLLTDNGFYYTIAIKKNECSIEGENYGK